mmetsp:Transcript_28914/g.52871  ORF Transcript_28914/g.52871 Transcript_28914/m.52871 type:complete len:781 (+) Transcript_28914:118-2460(+)
MVRPMYLAADPNAQTTLKILTTAKRANVKVELKGAGGQTSLGLHVPELTVGDRRPIRHAVAIMRHIAQISECGLLGSSFIEEGQIDSWMEWGVLDVDYAVLDDEWPIDKQCEALEAHLKNRTFLVGQRLTLADISIAVPLLQAFKKTGIDTLKATYPATVRWFLTCKHQLGLELSAAPVAPSKPAPAAAKTEKKAAPEPKPKAEAKAPAPAPTPAPAPAASAAPEADAGGAAEGGSKKDEKKAAKKAAKEAAEAEKKRKQEELKAAAESKHKGPDVTLLDFESHTFGNLFIQSQCKTERKWSTVKDMTPELKDQNVWMRTRVHNSRKQGGKLCFLTLRKDLATVQAVVFGAEMAGFAGALPDESVVDVYGKVSLPKDPVTSCTQSEVEIAVEKLFCLARSQALPLQLADAGRPEPDYEKDPNLVKPGQDTCLNNRVIDLRTHANQGILRIQSGVGMLFREFLSGQGFVEIHTPKMISAASEGGADVFRVDYFEGNAYLAQSPQLYKQAALMTDLPKVFEVGPIFRSERSFTHRHMTEFTGLDMEMTFMEHYGEVLDVLDGMFNHIFTGLNKHFKSEIEAVRRQYPFEDLKWKHPCLRLTFKDAIALMKEKGPPILKARIAATSDAYTKGLIEKHLESVLAHDPLDDVGTEDEKLLGKIIHEEFGEDFYIIDKFPKAVRPFYTMPDPNDPTVANAYDFFLRGEEITSGAQRIHDPKMLWEKAAEIGVDLSPIQWYVDAFKYGAFPHAGAGIGLERVVMLFMALHNIRKSSMFPRDPKRLTP